MAKFDANEPAVEWSFDELASALAGDAAVPRRVRRRVLSDARRFVQLVEAGGVAPGAVRFRAIRCTCCGDLEVTGVTAPGARCRLH